MTRKLGLTIVSVLVGAFALGADAIAQSDVDREARREQIRRSRALLAEAVDAIDAGEHESASVSLRTILEDDPRNADAHYHLGRTLLAQGDTTGARAILLAGTEKAPLSTRMKLLLARLHIIEGSPEAAAALLDGILKLRPKDGETLYLRGLAHLAVGDSLAALEAWRTSLEIAVEGGRP